MPRIDAVRRCLSTFDLDGLKVVALDGVELFESTKKCCDKCLFRVHKNGVTHYFHRSVVCATVGSDPHIILGQEMLEPKQDESQKDERLHIVKDALAMKDLLLKFLGLGVSVTIFTT